MHVEDLVDRLVHLGLDPGEARVYVHLNGTGPSKASDLALVMKLHRTDAYRTLQRLVDLGFATASLDRPVVFSAAPPDAVFARLLSERAQQLATIERVRDEIADALATLRSEGDGPAPRETFRIIRGRSEIYRAMMLAMQEARREIVSVNTNAAANASSEASGAWSVAKERARAGVQIRALNRTTFAVREAMRSAWQGLPVAFRHLDHERPMRFLVADAGRVIMVTHNDPSGRLHAEDEVAVESDAPDLIGMMLTFFEALWERGVDLQDMDGLVRRVEVRADDLDAAKHRQ